MIFTVTVKRVIIVIIVIIIIININVVIGYILTNFFYNLIYPD